MHCFILSVRSRARNSCCLLFLEIVSEVIFAAPYTLFVNSTSGDELISALIDIVIPNAGPTQKLSPLDDSEVDETPIIRSNLLQLLLDHQ